MKRKASLEAYHLYSCSGDVRFVHMTPFRKMEDGKEQGDVQVR